MITKFITPIAVALCILVHVILQHLFGLHFWADIATWLGTAIGSVQLLKNTAISIKEKRLALDYIAIMAIVVALLGHYYLVSTVIALMLSGGYSLEDYGMATAKQSLTALINRIPTAVQLWENDHISGDCPIAEVQVGQQILVRKGEVVPLDGTLLSAETELDESSITGEPYLMEKHQNDAIRSGTVNIGNPIVISVTATAKNSTYHHIIAMVLSAQHEKSPMIRMADRYSGLFILLTVGIAGVTYILTQDMSRVLAVLVIATPCPLILATPIALMGGVSSASKRHTIIKDLASIEILSKVTTLIFDKTGTLTLGKPFVSKFTCFNTAQSALDLISAASAIERNSLHPLAKAIVVYAKDQKAPTVFAQDITEKIGTGISGTIDKTTYTLSKKPNSQGMTIGIYDPNQTLLAEFEFEDHLKTDSHSTLHKLHKTGLNLFLFTGDQPQRTHELLDPLGLPFTIEANCSPTEKKEKIAALKQKGCVTAMIGDGINDAPALAAADVGMVFSHDEQTAATDAANIVFLGGDLNLVLETLTLSKHTIKIAKQCILFGIGASTIGMAAAAMGYLPPIWGAILQEVIDITVILYALRTSFYKPDKQS